MATKNWSCLLTRYEAFVCVICDLVCCYDLRLSCCQSAQFLRCEERSEDCQGDLVLSYVITKTGDELGPLCIIRCILVSCRSFKRFLSLLQLMNGAGMSPASSQARYPGQCHPLLDIVDRYLHIIDT